MKPLVSIITPIFNSEKYLSSCLEAVQNQSYKYWEHILVDDCSSDSSSTIVRAAADNDKRIKYLRLEHNSGAGVARNTAIKMAKGDYIAFLDSDDVWLPCKLERQVSFMLKNNYYFTFTSYGTMTETGQLTKKKFKAKRRVTYRSALYKNPIGCLTVMYDVGFFGKQYMPTIRKRQDYALWLALLKKTDGYGLQEVLATYRNGNKSVSSNKMGLIKYEWKIYREVEGFSIIKSGFYLLSAIVLKMKSYF